LLTSLAENLQNHPTIPELSPFVPRFSMSRSTNRARACHGLSSATLMKTDKTNLVVTSHA